MIIQFLGLIFGVFAVAVTFKRFREGKISLNMFLVWFFAWTTIIAFLFQPQAFEGFSRKIGIRRPLDFMLTVRLLLVFYLNFRLYVYLEDLRRDLASLIGEFGIHREKEDE